MTTSLKTRYIIYQLQLFLNTLSSRLTSTLRLDDFRTEMGVWSISCAGVKGLVLCWEIVKRWVEPVVVAHGLSGNCMHDFHFVVGVGSLFVCHVFSGEFISPLFDGDMIDAAISRSCSNFFKCSSDSSCKALFQIQRIKTTSLQCKFLFMANND